MLTISDGTILVEFSYAFPPMDFFERLKEIQRSGYNIVLAHPERYLYLNNSDYKQLKDMKIKLQLNIPSICGVYGPDVRKRAEEMLKSRLYSIAGTDIHSLSHFKTVVCETPLKSSIIEQLRSVFEGRLGYFCYL